MALGGSSSLIRQAAKGLLLPYNCGVFGHQCRHTLVVVRLELELGLLDHLLHLLGLLLFIDYSRFL